MLTKQALEQRAEARKRIIADHKAKQETGEIPPNAACLPIVAGDDSFCPAHAPPRVESVEQAKLISSLMVRLLNEMVPDALAMANGNHEKAGEIMDLLGCPVCYLRAKKAAVVGGKERCN